MKNWSGLAIVLGSATLAFNACKTRTNNEDAKVNIFGWSKEEKEAKEKEKKKPLLDAILQVEDKNLGKIFIGDWIEHKNGSTETAGTCHLRVEGRLWSGYVGKDEKLTNLGTFDVLTWLVLEPKDEKLAIEMAKKNPSHRAFVYAKGGQAARISRIVFDEKSSIVSVQVLDKYDGTIKRECVLTGEVAPDSAEGIKVPKYPLKNTGTD